MGAWGTALFSDDTACDVRDSYLDLVGDGLLALRRRRRFSVSGPFVSTILTGRQYSGWHWPTRSGNMVAWKSHVLQQALNVINSGSDLAKWESGSKDFKKRKVVLDRLRTRLTSPQSPEKRIHKRFRDANERRIGGSSVVSHK